MFAIEYALSGAVAGALGGYLLTASREPAARPLHAAFLAGVPGGGVGGDRALDPGRPGRERRALVVRPLEVFRQQG
jgi:hypothetical protein